MKEAVLACFLTAASVISSDLTGLCGYAWELRELTYLTLLALSLAKYEVAVLSEV